MLLDRYATYTGADPRRAPAALVAVPYAELAFGGWYLRGGLGTLADALLSRCLDLGVVVQTGTAVTRIDAAGGRVHGVRLAGVRRAGPRRRGGGQRRRARPSTATCCRTRAGWPGSTDRSLAGFVLLLGVAGDSGLAHHNVFFPPTTTPSSTRSSAIRGAACGPGRRPTRRSSSPSPTTRWSARTGTRRGSCWSTPPGTAPRRAASTGAGRAWPTRTPTGSSTCWPSAASTCATGCCSGRCAPRPTWTRRPAAPGGAIYGTAGGLLRPANRGTGTHGLCLVGGSTHPGGGLPMVTLSAQIVADRIGPAW